MGRGWGGFGNWSDKEGGIWGMEVGRCRGEGMGGEGGEEGKGWKGREGGCGVV